MSSADLHRAVPIGDVVLSARNVIKHYPVSSRKLGGRRHVVRAVDDVSFDLRRGETLGIVGESGCGKSTLTKILTALERPTSGAVTFEGRDLFAMSKRELRATRRSIQLIMQDPYTSLNPRMTVGQIVGEPFAIHPEVLHRNERLTRVKELLDLVGLSPDHIRRYPHQFSGGQRQRIGIARALALDPKVLICDEPVSALDVSIQAQVVNLMVRLQRELGLAYIFIAHDLSVVRHISDRVAVMYLGRLVESGTGDEIFEEAAHPYTLSLLSAIPDPGDVAAGASERIVLQGEVPSPLEERSGCSFTSRCWRAEPRCSVDDPDLEVRHGVHHDCACHFPGRTMPVSITRGLVP